MMTEKKIPGSMNETTDNERKSSYTQRNDDQNKSMFYSGFHNSSIQDIENNLNQNNHMQSSCDKRDKSVEICKNSFQ